MSEFADADGGVRLFGSRDYGTRPLHAIILSTVGIFGEALQSRDPRLARFRCGDDQAFEISIGIDDAWMYPSTSNGSKAGNGYGSFGEQIRCARLGTKWRPNRCNANGTKKVIKGRQVCNADIKSRAKICPEVVMAKTAEKTDIILQMKSKPEDSLTAQAPDVVHRGADEVSDVGRGYTTTLPGDDGRTLEREGENCNSFVPLCKCQARETARLWR